MTGIAITILIKRKDASANGEVYFHDIGDYLDQKRKTVSSTVWIDKWDYEHPGWQTIQPDEDNDWVNQGDKSFSKFLPLGNKRSDDPIALFENYSLGLSTNRDAWCYNFSIATLAENCSSMIEVYNNQVDILAGASIEEIKNKVPLDEAKISWSRGLFYGIKRGQRGIYCWKYPIMFVSTIPEI